MVLSIDTGFDILGLALLDENLQLVFSVNYRQLGTFSEKLVEKIDFHLKEYNIEKQQINKVVVNKGPGGYTGLRVGITTAKTLAYALKLPLYAYVSLDVLQYKHRHHEGRTVVAINAGRKEAYIKVFENGKSSDINLIKQQELPEILSEKDLLITKNLTVNHPKMIEEKESLAVEGAEFAISKSLSENPITLEPVYIRKT